MDIQRENKSKRISEMYTKDEIKEVLTLSLHYKELGDFNMAQHFNQVYHSYTAFSMIYFDMPICNN